MIIDCHYHLETRLLTIEELLERMDKSGVDKVALMAPMVEPFPEPAPFLVGMLQFMLTHSVLRTAGKQLVASFTPDGDVKILGKSYKIEKNMNNEIVFDMVRKYSDRFLGWVFVNPSSAKDPLQEIEKYRDSPGFVGAKAHSFWHHYEPIKLASVAEKLKVMDKPLLIHVGFDKEGDFMRLVREVSGLKLILAHAGFPYYKDTWKQIKEHKNIFVDLSQTSYVGEKITKDAVDFLGVERCLFGTDGPFGFHGMDGKYDYGFIKRRIEKLFPDSGIQKRLLGENFREIANIR
jgi:predicted TIM-barrel fold metal-dependent hydrolase